MSIAAMKRARKRLKKNNRHLAKIGRPGTPKKVSAEQSAHRLAKQIEKLKTIASNKAKSKKS